MAVGCGGVGAVLFRDSNCLQNRSVNGINLFDMVFVGDEGDYVRLGPKNIGVCCFRIIMEKSINDVNYSRIMTIKAKNGRIYLPKEIREKYGERFRMIECRDRIVLLPVSEEPLKKLREEWEDVEWTREELKEKALKEGMDEAGG